MIMMFLHACGNIDRLVFFQIMKEFDNVEIDITPPNKESSKSMAEFNRI